MKTVDIPGGVATLREQGEFRGRDRNLINAVGMSAAPILSRLPDQKPRQPEESQDDYLKRMGEAVKNLSLSTKEALTLIEMREAAAVASLASWTLEIPLPTMETIGDLPDELYQGLVEAVGGAALGAVSTDFEPSDPKSPEFERSPFDNSSSSDLPSREDEESPEPTSSTPIEATATAESSPG